MNPILSLILPVYKVEAYVGACLDSILVALEQVEADESFEVICVDDGSPDRCGEILESYRERFAALAHADRGSYTVIHQKNAGVSAARNAGLDAATGEWVWFIDSDDSIAPFALAFLTRELRKHPADVFRFGYQRVPSQTAAFPSEEKPVSDYDLTKDPDVCRAYEDGWIMSLQSLLWNACYRRSSIGDVRFCIGMQPGEDDLFALQVLSRARTLAATQTTLYNYLQRPGSCMMTRSLKKTKSAIESFGRRQTIVRDWPSARAAMSHLAYFKWLRNEMYGLLCQLRGFSSDDRRLLFPLCCEVGVSVFAEFPSYQMVFRTRSFFAALLFVWVPMKVRIFLLRIRFVSWLKTKVRGC